MSNAVANRSAGAVAALSNLKRGIQNTRQAIPASSTMPILRMGTDGIWVYGQENTEVEEGSRWAINPLSIQHGFVCWTNYAKADRKKNELLGEVYASMTSDPIDPASLPDKGWPWKAATTVQLKCVSGEDNGEEVIYKPSSVGGGNAMQALLDAIEEQLDTSTDEIVPLVELVNDHYQHKQYGKTYVPQFDVVGWAGMYGPVEDEPEEEQAQAPAPAETGGRSRRRSRAETPAPEADASADEEEAEAAEEPAAEEPKTEGRVRRRRRSA